MTLQSRPGLEIDATFRCSLDICRRGGDKIREEKDMGLKREVE